MQTGDSVDASGVVMRYNRGMLRSARIGFVLALAVAVASVPLMLDQCAATCEMHHETVASTPVCHHRGSTGAHLGQTPGSCGHDHNSTSVAPDDGSAPNIRTARTSVTVVVTPTILTAATTPQRIQAHDPPGLDGQQFDRRALPLRI